MTRSPIGSQFPQPRALVLAPLAAAASTARRDDWEVGGSIGTDFGSLDLGRDRVAWDVGVARYFAYFDTVDLRYYDSDDDPDTVVVSLSADF